MKLSRVILVLVFVQSVVFVQAQESESKISSSVNSIEIKANTVEEIKSIDWDDLFSVFDENSPKDFIKLGIQFENMSLGKSDTLNSMKFSITGLTESKETIKKHLKKGTKVLIKAIEESLK